MSFLWFAIPAACVALISVTWVSRRTDELRRVDPKAAQRIDEARFFRGA